MRTFIANLVCRFMGRKCSVRWPSSRDLITEMQDHARRTEAKTVEIRRRRERVSAVEADLFPRKRTEAPR